MKLLEIEKKKIENGRQILNFRREYWQTTTKKKIQNIFDNLVSESQKIDYPFKLSCVPHDNNKNEETVQLYSGVNKTGVILNKVIHHENSVEEKKTCILKMVLL